MTGVKRLERLGKLIIASGLARLQRSEARPVQELDLSRVQRVLFVRVNFRMGNLLLATPGFAAARTSLPHSEIDLLTTSAYSQLLDGNQDVDDMFMFNRGMLVRPWALFGLVRRIRRRQYDLVIDCSGGESLTGALFAGLSRGRWRVGSASGRHEGCFNVLVALEQGRVHKVDALLALLESIGIRAESRDMKVILAPDERRWAQLRWSKWGLSPDRETVGVNIGARGDKRWPMDHFLDVVRGLDEELGAQVVMFVGPQERERLKEVGDRLPATAIVDTTSEPRRFAALLARCTVVITGDTGPMHLAAAVGVPTVSIFRKHNFEFYAPQGAFHRFVYVENGVGTAAVIDALSDLLHSVPRSSPQA